MNKAVIKWKSSELKDPVKSLFQTAEAEFSESVDINIIEASARKLTPVGFYLKSIYAFGEMFEYEEIE